VPRCSYTTLRIASAIRTKGPLRAQTKVQLGYICASVILLKRRPNVLNQFSRPERLRRGHCSRCATALGEAFMLSSPCWPTKRTVPVCSACVTDNEAATITTSRICKACGLTMHGANTWKSHFCSTGCRERVDRARRPKAPLRQCRECGTQFVGKANALFCSIKCRVHDFRKRHVTNGASADAG
jgi:hypothetical protein